MKLNPPSSCGSSFSNKGRTIGSYFLQYGYKILESNKLVYENMLSNHDLAEITVLNAKEKAKAKQLTTLSDETEKDGVFSLWNGQRPLYDGPARFNVTYSPTTSTMSFEFFISSIKLSSKNATKKLKEKKFVKVY